MAVEDKKKVLEQSKIKIIEYRYGAWSGEFPTIIVAILSGIAGGILSSIGEDIWKKLKEYIYKRFSKLERDRLSKRGTRKARSRVICVYIVTEVNDVPLI